VDDKIDLPYPLLDPDPENQSLATKALRVPAEMIFQVASGLDAPEAIALRYGYTEDEFKALSSWTPFVQEVAKVRAELEKSGYDFTLDSRLKAKELSNVIFLRAMSTDATFGQVHDAFRTFTEFADLKPKQKENQSLTPGHTGFSINIILNPDSGKNKTHVIDVTPEKETMGTVNPFVAKTN
jgi:hypothetical protein